MSKLIAAINITVDGFCDHTAGIPDEQIHNHYTELLNSGDAIVYGRITYQLMENFWPLLVKNPSGEASMDDFAAAIDRIPKLVFSHTLDHLEWETARLAKAGLKEEVLALKKQATRDVFVGSPSLIVALTELHLIDEYQLCVHPVIIGSGLPLFKYLSDRMVLRLLKTKTFDGGAIILYYEPAKNVE